MHIHFSISVFIYTIKNKHKNALLILWSPIHENKLLLTGTCLFSSFFLFKPKCTHISFSRLTCTSKLCCCCCWSTALSTWWGCDGGGGYWCGCWSYGAGGGCSAKCSNCWFTDSASVTPKCGARWGGMWCKWGGNCSCGFNTTTPVSKANPFLFRSSSAGDGCLLPGVRLKQKKKK